MNRSVLSFFFLMAIIAASYGQGKDNSLRGVPVRERIVTGGGIGLGFGSTQDFFSVSPVLGYSLTKKLIAGSGFTFRYTNYKYFNPAIKLTDYALNPFVRYAVYKGFFVQAEYEYLNYEFPVTLKETTRMNFDSFLAGGGIIQPIGRNLAFYAMALYNFSYTTPTAGRYSPYNSPLVIRAGINIGGFLGY